MVGCEKEKGNTMSEDEEGGGIGGWVIWIGILALINLLSWAFGWNFWLY